MLTYEYNQLGNQKTKPQSHSPCKPQQNPKLTPSIQIYKTINITTIFLEPM
jgi:hypothetical protein